MKVVRIRSFDPVFVMHTDNRQKVEDLETTLINNNKLKGRLMINGLQELNSYELTSYYNRLVQLYYL